MEAGRRRVVIIGAVGLVATAVIAAFLVVRRGEPQPAPAPPPTAAPREVIVAKAPVDDDSGPAPPISLVLYGDGTMIRRTASGVYETGSLPAPTKDGLLAQAAQALPQSLGDASKPTRVTSPDPLLYTQVGGILRSAAVGPPGSTTAELDQVLEQVANGVSFVPWTPDRLLLRASGSLANLPPPVSNPNVVIPPAVTRSWPPGVTPQPSDVGACHLVTSDSAKAMIAIIGAPSTVGRWSDAKGTWDVIARPDLLHTACG